MEQEDGVIIALDTAKISMQEADKVDLASIYG